MMFRKTTISLCVIAWCSIVRGAPTSAPAPDLGRDGDLRVALPEIAGVDSAKLVALCQFLNASPFDVRSLLIARRGKLVFERYEQHLGPEHNFAMYSVTKSFTSTLAGIATGSKLLAPINTPILPLLRDVPMGQADARKSRIKLEDLLTMRSGLKWLDTSRTPLDPGTDLTAMTQADDRTAFVLRHDMAAEPGQIFNYSNGDAQLVASILRRATKMTPPAYAEKVLFSKLTFRNVEWAWVDSTGQHPGGYGLRLRPRDMLKFGQLFLQKGVWRNQQVVPSEWVERATSDQTKNHYGYYWWVRDDGGRKGFLAAGLKGQYILVVPDLELVVAMTSKFEDGKEGELLSRLIKEFIFPACVPQPLAANPASIRGLEVEFRKARDLQRTDGQTLSEDDTPRVPGRGR